MCGKDFKKDFYLYYSNTHVVYYTSGLNNYIPVRINQFHIIVCKRNKTNAVIKNLITGESKTFSVSELIDNPGVYYLWRYQRSGTSTSKTAIAGQTICNGYFSTDEDDEKVLDWYKKQMPWLFPDQAWTVTGKTNEDEDRATIANITGNGNNLVLSNFAFSEGSGYGLWPVTIPQDATTEGQPYGTFHFTEPIYSSIVSVGVTKLSLPFTLRGLQEGMVCIVRVYPMDTTDRVLKHTTYTKDGDYVFEYDDADNPGRVFIYNGNTPSTSSDFYLDIKSEYEGYLVTDGVDDYGRAVNLTISKDFTVVGDWVLLSKDSVNAGLSIHPQFHIFNRPDAIQIMFRSAGKTLPVKTLKALCSDGRCYDENWNELKINVGEFADNRGILYIGNNGTNFTQIAFKNLGVHNDQLFSKEDCIKAYNYLQSLKAK